MPHGYPWTHEDDLRLIELVGSISDRDHRKWFRIARELRRSALAAENRWYQLKSFLSKPQKEIRELKKAFVKAGSFIIKERGSMAEELLEKWEKLK